jgi:hypothetical protein
LNAINEHIQQNTSKRDKLVVKKNLRYHKADFNRYYSSRRAIPHPYFAHARPDFVYEPMVKFVIVDAREFNYAVRLGGEYFRNNTIDDLIATTSTKEKTLVYLLGNNSNSSNFYANLHAWGGNYAAYCLYENFPLGPAVKGLCNKDSSITQSVEMHVRSESPRYCTHKYTRERNDGMDEKRRKDAKNKRRLKQLLRNPVNLLGKNHDEI